jgi:hypothetical protein
MHGMMISAETINELTTPFSAVRCMLDKLNVPEHWQCLMSAGPPLKKVRQLALLWATVSAYEHVSVSCACKQVNCIDLSLDRTGLTQPARSVSGAAAALTCEPS